jgi:Flp pilus assembly protein TadG
MSRKALMDRLANSADGNSALEFALLAPVFLLFLFTIIEGCWMLWQYEILTGVASDSARCMAVGSSNCSTTSATATYAASLAGSWGLTLPSADVTVVTGTTCAGVSGLDQVSITFPLANPVAGLLPGVPSSLSVSSCFPISS